MVFIINKMTLLWKLGLGIRLIIGILLIFAGTVKALHPVQFAFQLRYDYSLAVFPTLLLSVIIPFLEIALGTSVLSARFALYGVQGVRILFASFIAFHAWRYFMKDLKLSNCSCFGSFFILSEMNSMLLAIILLIASFFSGASSTGKASYLDQLLRLIWRNLKTFPGFLIPILLLPIMTARYLYIQRDLQADPINIRLYGDSQTSLENLLRQNLSERLSLSRMNVVVFIRSPGCSSCRGELQYWSESRYTNVATTVGVVPESASPGIENLARQLRLKYSITAIPDRAFNQVIGRYNYIGRILLTKEGKILFANGNQRGEASRIAFTNFLEYYLRSSDSLWMKR